MRVFVCVQVQTNPALKPCKRTNFPHQSSMSTHTHTHTSIFRCNYAYDWFQTYRGIRHLLTPYHLAASKGLDPGKPRRIQEGKDGADPSRDRIRIRNNRHRFVTDRISPTKVDFPTRSRCRVLVLGCGNSNLAFDMLQDGWTGGITNVDFSSVVIDQMKEKCQLLGQLGGPGTGTMLARLDDVSRLEFLCADVTEELPFPPNSFDLIICKGTLDAIVSGTGGIMAVRSLMMECHRLLKDSHGSLVVVTHGNPESRIVHFENDGNEWWHGVGIHCLHRPSPIRGTPQKEAPRYCTRNNTRIMVASLQGRPVGVPLLEKGNHTNDGSIRLCDFAGFSLSPRHALTESLVSISNFTQTTLCLHL